MIKAKENILANGTQFKPGDVITGLTPAQERQLLQSKSAEPVSEDAPVSAEVKKAESTKPVATEVPDKRWNKTKLLGHARKLGLTVEETMTKDEILAIIEANPNAEPPKDDDKAELTTPAVTHLPENAPSIVPQAQGPESGDETPQE